MAHSLDLRRLILTERKKRLKDGTETSCEEATTVHSDDLIRGLKTRLCGRSP